VQVEPTDRDGRVVAVIVLPDRPNLNHELVGRGWPGGIGVTRPTIESLSSSKLKPGQRDALHGRTPVPCRHGSGDGAIWLRAGQQSVVAGRRPGDSSECHPSPGDEPVGACSKGGLSSTRTTGPKPCVCREPFRLAHRACLLDREDHVGRSPELPPSVLPMATSSGESNVKSQQGREFADQRDSNPMVSPSPERASLSRNSAPPRSRVEAALSASPALS
jgi:hypothetical protein